MCAIVDANVAHEVFRITPAPAGEKFFEWINKGTRRLVAGGKHLEDLENSSADFRQWATGALLAGKMRIVDYDQVHRRTLKIQAQSQYESDDPHLLALAQISGSRLLYSNDRDLHRDFRKKVLIDKPRGKVYSTLKTKSFTRAHGRLLRQNDLCQVED